MVANSVSVAMRFKITNMTLGSQVKVKIFLMARNDNIFFFFLKDGIHI